MDPHHRANQDEFISYPSAYGHWLLLPLAADMEKWHQMRQHKTSSKQRGSVTAGVSPQLPTTGSSYKGRQKEPKKQFSSSLKSSKQICLETVSVTGVRSIPAAMAGAVRRQSCAAR